MRERGGMLYPGEELTQGAGYPALMRFQLGRPGQPLVAFITGGGVLGRIAYGPPGGRPADFLCHWLGLEGFSSLALSYPLDGTGVFDAAYPQFSMLDWAAQSAEIIARCVAAHDLPRPVLVLGWSMGGRIAEPLEAALRRHDLEIELFVALAGAAALPNLLPGLGTLRPSETGLASIQGAFAEWLRLCLAGQNGAAGRTVLDPRTFIAEMTGDFPVGLAASAMRRRDGRFVADPEADAREIGAADYAGFPPLALMTHTAAVDARHALIDRSAWGFFITKALAERHLFSRPCDFAALPPDRWARMVQLVHEAPARLSAALPGNHMFFVGEAGARQTVQALKELRSTASDLARALSAAAE